LGLSIIIDSENPVVVQRNVKFRWRLDPESGGRFVESALDFERRSKGWIFAGGDTNNAANNNITEMTYSIYNPAATQVTVNITYYYADGTVAKNVLDFKVNGNSRVFIKPSNNLPGFEGAGINKLVAVKFSAIESEIYVERLLYFSKGNVFGGNAVFGHATDP
jgi:hypothetical protein